MGVDTIWFKSALFTEQSVALSSVEASTCRSVVLFFVKQISLVMLNSADWRFRPMNPTFCIMEVYVYTIVFYL